MLHNYPVLYYLLASTLLYWIMLMYTSMVHAKGWTLLGMLLMFSNRDNMPERSAMVARADRATRNMAENLLIFAIVTLMAVLVGASREKLLLGGQIFFFARLAYFPVYLAGIPYLRTAAWAAGVVGIVIVGNAMW